MPGTLRPATRGGWSTWWQEVSGGRPRYEASRTDDCDVARETRFYPSMVVRKTRDGVLVVFHDDMLDRLLDGYGDVSDCTWEELQRFRFRNPGRFGEHCRIPTLVEVFDLHRKYGAPVAA